MIVGAGAGSDGGVFLERFGGIVIVFLFAGCQLEQVVCGVLNECVAVFTEGINEFLNLG